MDIYQIEQLFQDYDNGLITLETRRHKMENLLQEEYDNTVVDPKIESLEDDIDRLNNVNESLESDVEELEKKLANVKESLESDEKIIKKLLDFLVLRDYDPQEILNAK